jgi:hypothetical protein
MITPMKYGNWSFRYKDILMPKKYFFLLVPALLSGSIFFSCRKDVSCKGCITRNKPPVANAGRDIIIVLPQDSVSLNGSASYDLHGNVKEYLWSKISGPSSFSMTTRKLVQTIIKNLTKGVYQFELKVTDSGNFFDLDTIQVIVYPDTLTELIFTDLIWNYWHDPNDPSHAFDEIFLTISDTANTIPDLPNSNFSVWVKRDSSSNWEQASDQIINGNCTAPFWYVLALGDLLVELCYPWNLGLVGQKGSVKIRY